MSTKEYHKTYVFKNGYSPTRKESDALRKYNLLMNYPPSIFSDDDELDEYYEECIRLHNMIKENIEKA